MHAERTGPGTAKRVSTGALELWLSYCTQVGMYHQVSVVHFLSLHSYIATTWLRQFPLSNQECWVEEATTVGEMSIPVPSCSTHTSDLHGVTQGVAVETTASSLWHHDKYEVDHCAMSFGNMRKKKILRVIRLSA